MFQIPYGSRTYSYAAIGVGGRWYLAGDNDRAKDVKTWTELMEFAGVNGRRSLRNVTRTDYFGFGTY